MNRFCKRPRTGDETEGTEITYAPNPPSRATFSLKQNILGNGVAWADIVKPGPEDPTDYRKLTCRQRREKFYICDDSCQCPEVKKKDGFKIRGCTNYFLDLTKTAEKYLKLIHVPGKGWGVESSKPIEQGNFILEYKGEIVTGKEYKMRKKTAYSKIPQDYGFDMGNGFICDPTEDGKGNIGKYLNHACGEGSNAVVYPYHTKGNEEIKLMVVAKEDIMVEEEIVIDYDFKIKNCQCKSVDCWNKTFKCSYVDADGTKCPYTTNSCSIMEHHNVVKHVKPHECSKCGVFCGTLGALLKHKRTKNHKKSVICNLQK